MTFTVYSINYLNSPIYIGYTSNITKREKQHNYLFTKEKKKDVYDYLKSLNLNDKIVLIPIKEFKSKSEAKRYEMLLILNDYFSTKSLKQKVPNISDR